MARSKLRRRIAAEAAKLLVARRETDYTVAKRRAARILGVRFTASDFPSTREIREACRAIEDLSEAGTPRVDVRRMQRSALALMHALRVFTPKLVGPLSRDEASTGLETLIDVHSSTLDVVLLALERSELDAVVEESGPSAAAPRRLGVVVVDHIYPAKLRVMHDQGTTELGMTLGELQRKLSDGEADIASTIDGLSEGEDRFESLKELLVYLEEIEAEAAGGATSEALHHALQLFDLVLAERPYDEEMLTAALVHDAGRLGRGADPRATAAALLDGLVTRRTLALVDGLNMITTDPTVGDHELATIVGREWLEDARVLARLDTMAHIPGQFTTTPADAIEYLQQLESETLWRLGS